MLSKTSAFFALIGALFSLSLAVGSAHAQATRTWVSGTGDDANPCSRTAPCKTFAGAFSKTAACGEIDVLDPGGYGAVTLTKGMTLDGAGTLSSILVTGGAPGITVNDTDATCTKVAIRNLVIQCLAPISTGAGSNGINVIQGHVTLENVTIQNFTNDCVRFQPSVRANMDISDSNFDNCLNAGIESGVTAGGINRINIVRSVFQRDGIGISLLSNTDLQLSNSYLLSDAGGLKVSGATSTASVVGSTFSNNAPYGIYAASGGNVFLSTSSISYNSSFGLENDAGATIVSFGNNWIAGNGTNGTPTSTMAPQ